MPKPANQPEGDERIPVPGESAAESGDEVKNCHAAEAVPPSVPVAGNAGSHGTDDCPDQSGGYCKSEAMRRESEAPGQSRGRAGNDGRIEAEEQASEPRDDGALHQRSRECHCRT